MHRWLSCLRVGALLAAALATLPLPAAAFVFDWATLGFTPITRPGTSDTFPVPPVPQTFTNVGGSGLDVKVTTTVSLGTGGTRSLVRPIAVTSQDGVIQELELYPDFGNAGTRQITVQIEFFKTGTTTPAAVTMSGLTARDIDSYSVVTTAFRDQVGLTSAGTVVGPTKAAGVVTPSWTQSGTTASAVCSTTLYTATNPAAYAIFGVGTPATQFTVTHSGGNNCATTATDPAAQRVFLSDFEFFLADFGDAPDTYGTTLANNGARNVIGSVFLGPAIDTEANGQPTAAANGDDLNGTTPDDEDGVIFTGALVLGQNASIQVRFNGGNGVFSAWFDWNRDGDFLDSGERVYNDTPFSPLPGSQTLGFTVPATAVPGTTYARFRYTAGTTGSTNSGSPTGAAGVGEVEDYQVIVVNNNLDFGDAPVSYGDASHVIPTTQNLWLATGALPFDVPDAEAVSQYSTGANGDNNTGTNDENGVTIQALSGGQILTTVRVSNGNAGQATLCAWLDGGGTGAVDGAFAGSERQCNSAAPGITITPFFWTVPNTVQINTYLRVRVTTDALSAASPIGTAPDGEVEDYQLIILPTRALISRFGVERDAATGLPAVVWDTASEQGTLGFYLERWDAGVEQWLRLNADLLPGLIDAPMGGQYRLIDDGVAEGEPHRYRLIELEAWGGTHTYGPFEVSVGGAALEPAAGPRVRVRPLRQRSAQPAPAAEAQGQDAETWTDWRALAPGFEGRARQPRPHPRGDRHHQLPPSETRP